MNEKEIIRGNASKIKSVPFVLIGLGLLIGVGGSLLVIAIAEDYMAPLFLIIGAVLLAWGIYLIIYVSQCEICVTDKRIYGKASFGSRVDIPMDSVSAVGTVGWLNGVAVSSASGSIKFLYIENANEIHSKVSQLIIDRQNSKNLSTMKVTNQDSNADELKKYKELLDSGVITQEEFDAKKKQLLGL